MAIIAPVTIVMYHYIRDLPKTCYPEIKGVLPEKFEGQLDYLTKHYTICSIKELISAFYCEDKLPPNPCLLTFDDGFIDHYQTVFPKLKSRGITGSFYPSAKAIEEQSVLDVHKIHFILASTKNYQRLVEEIFELISPFRTVYDILDNESLYKMYSIPGRYDTADIIFIKRILQMGLLEKVRSEIVDTLFIRYVGEDEKTFAKELYMDIAQLQSMLKEGMEIGGHGYKHVWFETLSKKEQQEEICRTLNFLTKIYGDKPSSWVMSYPYGSYNKVTIELLNRTGCDLALTSYVGLVSELSNPLELNRLDTNDLPFF